MIPYFEYHAILIGPITLQVWGLWVSIGVIAAILLSDFLAKKYFLSRQVVWDMAVWALLAGFIGARIGHVLFYEPMYFLGRPIEVLYFWQGGASSLGGFVGAGLAIWLFAKNRKFTRAELLAYLDVLSPGFWLGWAIGRIGCFFIHDHPGILSNFFLAVNAPGGARFDLGLLDSFLAWFLFIFCLTLIIKWKKRDLGMIMIHSVIIYAFFRFWLDFLRVADTRFFYLTPAQWGMSIMFLGLTFWQILRIIKQRKKTNGEVAYPPEADPPRAGWSS